MQHEQHDYDDDDLAGIWRSAQHRRAEDIFSKRTAAQTIRFPTSISPTSRHCIGMETSGREPHGVADGPFESNGGNISDRNHFRKWAAQVARQAGEEPDAAEAQRLLSIAEYWVQLADSEESNKPVDGPG